MWGYSALAASTRAIVPPSSGRYFHAAPSPPPKPKYVRPSFILKQSASVAATGHVSSGMSPGRPIDCFGLGSKD